jgi:hypothetical protein
MIANGVVGVAMRLAARRFVANCRALPIGLFFPAALGVDAALCDRPSRDQRHYASILRHLWRK